MFRLVLPIITFVITLILIFVITKSIIELNLEIEKLCDLALRVFKYVRYIPLN